ncbi:unnamed protein product, partial [Brassica rapa subsp. trilocularis]
LISCNRHFNRKMMQWCFKIQHEVDEYLKVVERHASGLLSEMRKDEYEVRENPDLNTWMQGGLDYIMLQSLNIDGIRTIGSVLGQTFWGPKSLFLLDKSAHKMFEK